MTLKQILIKEMPNIIMGVIIGFVILLLFSFGCTHAPPRPAPCATCPPAQPCPECYLEGLPTNVDPAPREILGCVLADDQIQQGMRLLGYQCGMLLGSTKVVCGVTLCGSPSDPDDKLTLCYAVCFEASLEEPEPDIEL